MEKTILSVETSDDTEQIIKNTTVNNSSWLTTVRKWGEIGAISTVVSAIGATAGYYFNNYLNQLATPTPGSNYNPSTDDPLSWWGAPLIGATLANLLLFGACNGEFISKKACNVFELIKDEINDCWKQKEENSSLTNVTAA